MKTVIFALLLLSAPAFADKDTSLPVLLETIANGIWISADTGKRHNGTRHFRFSIIPNEYTGSAQLEILIDTPEGQSIEPATYKFDYDGVEYPIADYVYRNGNQYFVYLPQLQANRRVEFSLGLQNTNFSHYRVTALLTVDNEQKSAEWVGWMRREFTP